MPGATSSFSEKSLTEWYYQIRGDASRRGVVNEVTLSRMATEGNLLPSDLVWNKATGNGWVPASTIPGLFPERVLNPEPVGLPAGTANPPSVSRRHRSSLPLLMVIGIVLISGASWFSQRLYLEELQLPTWFSNLLGIRIVDTKIADINLHCRLIDLYLLNEQLEKARSLVAELSKHDEYAEQTTLYRSRLVASQNALALKKELAASVVLAEKHLREERVEDAVKLIARLKTSPDYEKKAIALELQAATLKNNLDHLRGLQSDLCNGRLDAASAKELVKIYEGKNQFNALLTLTENTLQAKNTLPAAACLDVARVYIILKKATHAKVALEHFDARSKGKGQEKDFLEAAKLYYAIGEPLQGAELLKKYTTTAPTSAAAWYEIAAIQAEAGDSKSALSSLRDAVEHGGNAFRQKAQADKRFSSVKDTWTFGRLVKPD